MEHRDRIPPEDTVYNRHLGPKTSQATLWWENQACLQLSGGRWVFSKGSEDFGEWLDKLTDTLAVWRIVLVKPK